MKKLMSILLMLSLLCLCMGAAAEPLTDMMGREVKLEKAAQRIVALTASNVEILYAIGAGDTLVGRGEYCDYPEECLALPVVNSGAETNIEQILALQPDVVIMDTMAQTTEQVEALQNAGVAVVVTKEAGIEGVYEAIKLIAAVTGREAEGEQVIQGMKDAFASLTKVGEGKTIYFEVSPLQWGLWTAGTGTFMNEVAEMMGLKNCFDDVEGWASISEEQVLERNPDYIVTITMYFGEGPTPTEELLARPGWENVTAIKNAAILNLVDNELSRPSPRLMQGAQMMYDFVYGGAEENAA